MRILFTPDHQKARTYMCEQLEQGQELSNQLLETTKFSKGSFSIYLPDLIPAELIEAFHSSLVLNKVYALKPASNEETYTFREEARFIQSFLQTEHTYAIWEDAIARLSDSNIDEAEYVPKPFFTYDQTLYPFISSSTADTETILDTMTYLADYPSIIVLTEYTQQISHKTQMNEAQLTSLASSAMHVLVGSHDNETWLIWSKGEK